MTPNDLYRSLINTPEEWGIGVDSGSEIFEEYMFKHQYDIVAAAEKYQFNINVDESEIIIYVIVLRPGQKEFEDIAAINISKTDALNLVNRLKQANIRMYDVYCNTIKI